MQIVEIADPVTLARLVRPDPRRSAGLHLSTIIGDLMRRSDPDRFAGPIKPEFVGIGIAFEDLLAATLRTELLGWEKPGEFVSEGIIMSPDAIHDMPEELKATWVSGRDGIANPKLLRYHLQARCYCRVLGTDQMRFRVLFVNGSYQPPFPELRTFVVTYSRTEIAETWNQMLQHAEDMGVRRRK